MKSLFLIMGFYVWSWGGLVCSFGTSDDLPLLLKIHRQFLTQYPDMAQKEIFLSVALPSDPTLSQWKKTQETFRVAKLKGGKGFQIVLLFDQAISSAEIELTKKSYGSGFVLMGIPSDDFRKISSIRNAILSQNGEIMITSLNENELFNQIHQHITR